MATTVNYLPSNPALKLFKVGSAFITSIFKSYRMARDASTTVKELNRLTNSELRDIGISRGDIYTIAHKNVTDYHTKIRGRV